MASLEQVQQMLTEYVADISETDTGDFELNYRGSTYLIQNSDLDEYIEKKDSLDSEIETRICNDKYFEQAITLERFTAHGIFRNEDGNSMESANGTEVITIGDPSTMFVLHMLNNQSSGRFFRRYISMGRRRGDEVNPLSQFLRIKTLKIATENSKKLPIMVRLAEAATFNFGFVHGVAFNFTPSWETTRYSLRRRPDENPNFPQQYYEPELINYYNLGLGTDSVVLTYLAFYNILEYFYPLVAENELHNKIKENIIQPDFSVKKRVKLRKLVKDISKLENKLNERESLKLVLSEYFEIDELIGWITDFEHEFGVYYTEWVNLFGTRKKLEVTVDNIINGLGSRIYSVRNALVHNKEGEIGRFIPYTEHDEILMKEIPLLRFIAEQLIIRSGTDIN